MGLGWGVGGGCKCEFGKGLQQMDEEPNSDMAWTVVKHIEVVVSKKEKFISYVLLAD
jgi:hypothetical protein